MVEDENEARRALADLRGRIEALADTKPGATGRALRALLVGSGEQPEWEYGVRWGDEPHDSRPTLCASREHAESMAAASHGDKIVRRTPARTIPAGEWEEMPDE